MQESCDGVRDRKRQDTYRRIHEAAVELTATGGLSAATVSDIADRAGVSRRTFFNYYATKEDAVLGITPPTVPADALDAFLNPQDDDDARDRFGRAMRLTLATMTAAAAAPESTPGLHKLLGDNPELVDRLKAHHGQIQQVLVDVLSERLAAGDEEPGPGDGSPEDAVPGDGGPENGDPAPPRPSHSDTARALVLLAVAVLRFARGSDPNFLDNPTPAAIDAALAAFRSAVKEIK